MEKVGFITTFLHSINATRESNKNGRFSARLGLVNLMLGREIKNVVFLGITEIFEERKYVAFLPCKSRANLIFQVLPDYI